mmetsp:Transcript_87605/g.165143  ORF Transcript_87605/g.165143 Transcript_87605/m.165143 type:complete len:373 (-) Transcript_87605:142-1260(-)
MVDVTCNGLGGKPIVLGSAMDFKKKHGAWQGRSKTDLAAAVAQVMKQKGASVSGTVTTLCVSPTNGSRLPCDALDVRQSIIGDAQCKDGWTAPASAKCKNSGLLLGDDNLFLESLLTSVTVGDEDLVREVISGAQAPRVEKVWATGDNVYVSGLDMSWSNFHIGDLLVTPGAVVVNTGYPHSACWKYATRAGDDPKDYINGKEGNALRVRGIKGAFLWPSASASATIRANEAMRIVRKGTPEYKSLMQSCLPPLEGGTELAFNFGGHNLRASATDTQAYVDLLVFAGTEANKLDYIKYKRDLPNIVLQELGLIPKGMEISADAKSGDGSLENVGIKINGMFSCPECRQRFDNERAQKLHWQFIHDPKRKQED